MRWKVEKLKILFTSGDYSQFIPFEITFSDYNPIFCSKYEDFLKEVKQEKFDIVVCDGVRRDIEHIGGNSFVNSLTLVAMARLHQGGESCVVLSTAYPECEDLSNLYLESGADFILYKPFGKKEIINLAEYSKNKTRKITTANHFKMIRFKNFKERLEKFSDFANTESFKLRDELSDLIHDL